MRNLKDLEQSHDLRLPDWGPYTKKYIGTSHIPDVAAGLRFDLSVFPGYYRRQVLVPNAKWESGFHPWEAAPDFSYYAYRYELEWKDQVYCDLSFSEMGPNARLVRSELFNHTAQPQNLVLHYMASMNFPPVRTYSDEVVQSYRVILPAGALWIDALEYTDLGFATPRPQDNLGPDGMWRGEVRRHGFVNGTGIGSNFGREAGDWVQYSAQIQQPVENSALLVRYRAPQGNAAFTVEGLIPSAPGKPSGCLELPETAEFSVAQFSLDQLPAGAVSMRLISQGSAPVELDGFVLANQSQAAQVRFEPVEWQPVPQIFPGPRPNSLVLKYANTDMYYGLAWLGEPFGIREMYTDELDRFLRLYVQEHVQTVLHGNGQGHFTNVFIRPVEVQPGQSKVIYGMVCSGSQAEVEQALANFRFSPDELDGIYQKARAKTARLEPAPAGDRYRFSQERMATTVLTNTVYPVYTRRRFIRHNTPGKWWDCLYTWDSGFVGLGLLELDVERAIDCLNAYTTPPGDRQAAFIHHGSMVPTQFYLFQELWNRTQDRGLLEYFYPRLQQYYRFFAGRLGSSTTRAMKSGLLKTWDYFYNSGGWDDYPPQVYVHQQALEGSVSPAVSSAHGIRIAKTLQMAARALGLPADLPEYQADIDLWSEALQRYSWDAESGYFSYVRHNAQGEPVGILRHPGGQNFDMGIDGTSPFYAGICTPAQDQAMVERLFSPDRLWTPVGITSVDQSAPYYKVDGYWNGAVWFPHQWFFWKALLDANEAGYAGQIAHTALETWRTEVEASYHCFEHFIVQSGRGAGWHQFGGLSAPVLSWYGAYHRPGRLTTGLDAWVQRHNFDMGNRSLEAEVAFYHTSPRPSVVIAAMAPGLTYSAAWNGQPASVHERYPGVLEISIDRTQPAGKLVINPVD